MMACGCGCGWGTMGVFSGFTAWGGDCGWGWISLKAGGGSSTIVVAGRFVGVFL